MATRTLFQSLLLVSTIFSSVYGYQNVIYWGQQSSGSEKALKNYCMDTNYDIIVIGFMNDWPTSQGDSTYPGMNIAGHCGDKFNGPKNLLNCPAIASDITYCQSQGKKVFISLGGADGTYGFSSDSQAQNFATMMWNLFLGGSSSFRPFGSAILDGIDLDIESGTSTGYTAFINALRSRFAGASKNYYISAAPQCPYPDDWLGPKGSTALQTAWFDYVWVQFYNNNCGLNYYPSRFNFNTWAAWATTISVNRNAQIFIGAPASASAAGEGYVNLATLTTIIKAMQSTYPTVFGGVMMWDAGTAEKNANIGASIQAVLKALPGGSGGGSRPTQAPTNPPVTAKPTNAPTAKPTNAPTQSSKPTNAPPTAKPTNAPTTKPSPTSKPPPNAPDFSGTCTDGDMKCATSETYRSCARSIWQPEQRCQQGLTCSPTGNVIYCI